MENGNTLGTPLTIIVNNKNTKKPEDYVFSKEDYSRPSHSDFIICEYVTCLSEMKFSTGNYWSCYSWTLQNNFRKI